MLLHQENNWVTQGLLAETSSLGGSAHRSARPGQALPSLQLFAKEDLTYAACVDPCNKSALGETHVAMPRLRRGFIGPGRTVEHRVSLTAQTLREGTAGERPKRRSLIVRHAPATQRDPRSS